LPQLRDDLLGAMSLSGASLRVPVQTDDLKQHGSRKPGQRIPYLDCLANAIRRSEKWEILSRK
jgi:hypothetical protein